MELTAWSIDSNDLRMGELTNHFDKYVVVTEQIKRFLEEREEKLFIVAPKGFGKTLLLKAKSQKYRDNQNEAVVLPKDTLCERMSDCTIQLHNPILQQLQKVKTWSELWEFSILTYILIHIDITQLPSKVRGLLMEAHTISDILYAFLQNYSNWHQYRRLLGSHISPRVKRLETPVILFVDTIDEAFNMYLGSSPRSSSYKQTPSTQIWVNAQLGLVQAIEKICLANQKLKIFTSLRIEAASLNRRPNTMQSKAHMTQLRYDKQQMRAIFDSNILRMFDIKKVSTQGDSLMKQFIGYTTLTHPYITESEDLFDCIYRHTFRRPREIVKVGRFLSRLSEEEPQPDNIFKKIKKISNDLLKQYFLEIIPNFNQEVYNSFCTLVNTNVLPKAQALKIDIQLQKKFKLKSSVLEEFYRYGLIGSLEKPSPNAKHYTQHFLPVAQYILHDKRFPPASDYYLLHPSMYSDISDMKYNPNIIGDKLSFIKSSLWKRILGV